MPIVSASSAPAPSILWKIAFFAGAYTNAEYIRQSAESSIFVESSSGDNNYIDTQDPSIFISYAPALFGGLAVYYSTDAGLTWDPEGSVEEPDLNPAPLSALSYSQTSYIQTVVLTGSDSDQSGTYTWDGTTFVNGKPKYMGPLISGAPENNYIYYASGDGVYYLVGYKTSNEEMVSLSNSTDLASNWMLNDGSSEPIVSNIIYTA